MTTNGTAPRPSQMSNQILGEAARRMLPVLAGRVLAAVTDRAVEKVDQLADRLHESTDTQARTPKPAEGQSRTGAAFAFLLEQARLFLAFVVRLASQALEMLRRATERLRERRAPEGIDEAPDLEEIPAPEDFDDEDDEDDEDVDDEFEDEEEGRATARV
ncbi:hypothetical protein EV188_103605 [Actinomycetospora succinea]|uniref:Uncharacterized protein n=1 Tax=Actinomycetospora succinea TaxID=663603 RepID=A0A4V3DAB9_9PSEU|nr:hypothetical protein [Actinomycetospora succinea]TDQ61098.1 hypothetical protein EV188_103605 [Actinomycetospora succinea]